MLRLPWNIVKPVLDLLEIRFSGPEQAKVVMDCAERFPLIAGGERGSKALDISTQIPTPSGWRQMGSLRTGDFVFSDDGKPCLVTQAHPITSGNKCYRVTFEDGQSIVADAGHLWTVQDDCQRKNSRRRKVNGREERVTPSQLVGGRLHQVLNTEEIARAVKVPATMRRVAFNRYSIVSTSAVQYPDVELKIPPYALGAWLGDGTSTTGGLTSADPEVLDKIGETGYRPHKVPSQKYGYQTGLSRELNALGVRGNKHIPAKYLTASIPQRVELLRGLMDTDGSIDTRGQCAFSNTNLRLISGFMELCFSLGLKPTVSESRAMLYGKDCGPVWTVKFMSDFLVAHLSRKATRQKLAPAGHSRLRFISSVEEVESRAVRCITVDSPSGLFLAGESYIPTHNSFSSMLMLAPHVYLLPSLRKKRFYTKNAKGEDVFRFNPSKDKWRNPDFLLFGPTFEEPRIEFQYLEDFMRKLDMIPSSPVHLSKPQDGAWRMTLKSGVVVATFSMQDPYAIRSVDLEGAVVCEAGNCSLDAVLRVQGRVSAKRGFIIYNGTLENSQLWYQNWTVMGKRPNQLGIKTYSLPTWVNRIEFPGGRTDPEILRLEAVYPEDLFAMRVAAEPRPPRNRVLPEVQPFHIQQVAWPEDADIEIWIDPGYATAHAVLWVAIWDEPERKDERGFIIVPARKKFYIFDEMYERGKTVSEMVGMVKANKFFPGVERGVIDIAAQGKRDGTESALEVYRRLMPRVGWNMKYWREAPLIDRIRTSAKSMQFTIDPKCVGLIAECGLGEMPLEGMHPWRYPMDKSGNVIGEKPQDEWNHSAKALGYGLLHHLGQVEHVGPRAKAVNRLRRPGFGGRPERLKPNEEYQSDTSEPKKPQMW